ncbi:peptidoglycan-binding protein [Bradyrhizobium erythrophlei]|uniref:peptidoglycan-binding domain-containing protein n=1 Tax=Bradyrhizobium erythrophlei TaxID=1437360 RepID=UPI0035EBC2B5
MLHQKLRANLWRDKKRAQEAASMSGRAMRHGEKEGDGSVRALQGALFRLQFNSYRLPAEHRPQTANTNPYTLSNVNASWGPFFITKAPDIPPGKRHPSAERAEFGIVYGPQTELSVRLFQQQAGFRADGLAGMVTLHRIDEILVYLGE